MKKQLEGLLSTIEYLKENHLEVPSYVYDNLDDVKKVMVKCCRKKRCKNCDRFDHYDETLGIWKCEECDKKPQ